MRENKKIIFVVGAAVMLLLVTSGGAIGANNASNKIRTKDVFEIRNVDFSKIELRINPPKIDFATKYENGQKYTVLEMMDEGWTNVEGEACLPVLRRMIEIPQGANLEILIESISWKQISLKDLNLPASIIPVQPSVIKIPGATEPFVINEAYYTNNVFTPSVIVKIVSIDEIRGHRFALIEVSPVQYNPVSGKLNIMTVCNLRINLHDSDIVETEEKINRYSSQSFEKIFETAFINYGFYQDMIGTQSRDQEGYLIIVYDQFFDHIQPHANWKQTKGFDVTVTKTSQISGGATKENIKAYIVDAYNNWQIPPSYVLLVGDVEQIPTWTGTKTGTVTDLYYVTIDQGNYFPDVIISRFSAANSGQVTVMADKTIYYEQGAFTNNEWIKKAAFIASDDMGGMAEQTHNHVINTYLLPNDYTCDKIYESTGGTTSHITNALNDGRSLCVYSGHGYSGGWSCVPFNQNNVQNLQNEDMYPFVCSHACSTNPFNNPECFGETWLRVENKGAIAFWGASASTYWDEDDILEKSMFKSWWEDNLETIGGMTNMALYYLYQHYGGAGRSQYYFEAYNVLGDSSVKIWRGHPSAPPETPSKPNGPSLGILNTSYSFTSSTTEPDGEDVYFLFDWGDGTNSGWLGPYASGSTVTASHSWYTVGDYQIKVTAKDIYNVQSGWSEPHTITIIANQAPENPIIKGPTKIRPQKEYLFTISTTDPDDHDIYLSIDWGDGNGAVGLGPYSSGQEVPFKHSWSFKGTYTIKVRATDTAGGESDWTTLDISVSLSRFRSLNYQILLEFLQKFPNAFPILRYILAI